MDASYNSQFNGRAFDMDPNLLEFDIQKEINQQHALSTGQPGESCASNYSSNSPTPPAPAHRQPQPYPARQISGYFPNNSIGMPPSTTSPVSPQYLQSVSGAIDTGFNYSLDYGNMPMNSVNGMAESRNNPG